MANASIEINVCSCDGQYELTAADENWNISIDADENWNISIDADENWNISIDAEENWNISIDAEENWGAEANSPPEVWGINPVTDTFNGIRISQLLCADTVDESILLRSQRFWIAALQDTAATQQVQHLQSLVIDERAVLKSLSFSAQTHITAPQFNIVYIHGSNTGHKNYLTTIRTASLENMQTLLAAVRHCAIAAYTLPEYSTILGGENTTAIRLQHWDYNYISALNAAAIIDPTLQLYLRDLQLTIEELVW